MNKYHDVKKISRVFTCLYHSVFYYSFEAPLQTSLVSGDDKVQRGIRKLQTYNDLALHVFFKRGGSMAIATATGRVCTTSGLRFSLSVHYARS